MDDHRFHAPILGRAIEPEDLVLGLADGIISFSGGAWCGDHEFFPLIDMKVCLGGDVIEASLGIDHARAFEAAIQGAIKAAIEATEGMETAPSGLSTGDNP